MTRILVVDDHAFMRKFVRTLIDAEEGWTVCGEAADGGQAIEQSILLNPDLIILDVQMPIMDGLQAARELLILRPHIMILILSVGEPSYFGKAAALSGARGYLEKSRTADHLVTAVNTILRNDTYFEHVN